QLGHAFSHAGSYMTCCSTSWLVDPNRSARPARPSGPSKTYSLSIRTIGSWRLAVLSWSCSWVSSFSLTSRSLRAASHSWREVTAGRLIAHLLSVGPRPDQSRLHLSDEGDSGRWTPRQMDTPRDGHSARGTRRALQSDRKGRTSIVPSPAVGCLDATSM